MKLGKMSLAAAVAIAGLSTASFADGHGIKVGSELNVAWTYSTEGEGSITTSGGDADGSITASASADGASAKVKINVESSGEVTTSTLEASFMAGPAKVTFGPESSLPGSYTDNPGSDVIKVSVDAAGFNIQAGTEPSKIMGDDSRHIVALSGNAGPAKINADLVLASTMSYAAVASASIAGADLAAGYAGGGDKTIMGASVGYAVAGAKLSVDVATGSAPAGIDSPSNQIGDLGNDDNLAFQVGATYGLGGATLGASYKMVGDAGSVNAGYDRKLNDQTGLEVDFNMDLSEGGSTSVGIEFTTSL